MSSHYIYLSCPVPDCSASESIYTGEVYLNDFPDSGPDSFEGETISTRCNEHVNDHSTDSPGFEGTRAALAALTIHPGGMN